MQRLRTRPARAAAIASGQLTAAIYGRPPPPPPAPMAPPSGGRDICAVCGIEVLETQQREQCWQTHCRRWFHARCIDPWVEHGCKLCRGLFCHPSKLPPNVRPSLNHTDCPNCRGRFRPWYDRPLVTHPHQQIINRWHSVMATRAFRRYVQRVRRRFNPNLRRPFRSLLNPQMRGTDRHFLENFSIRGKTFWWWNTGRGPIVTPPGQQNVAPQGPNPRFLIFVVPAAHNFVWNQPGEPKRPTPAALHSLMQNCLVPVGGTHAPVPDSWLLTYPTHQHLAANDLNQSYDVSILSELMHQPRSRDWKLFRSWFDDRNIDLAGL